MSSIARASADVFGGHVVDDHIHVFNTDDDFDSAPLTSTSHTTSLACAGGTATQNEAEYLDAGVLVESSRNPGGRSEQGPRRDEDRPSTIGEREETSNVVGSQNSSSDEDPAQGADDDETLVGDVDDGNRPQVDAEHRRLSVVEYIYNHEDMLTPELSTGNDEDDTGFEFARSHNSEEGEGPVAIERVENGTPHISVMGAIVPVDYSQRRKRTRLVFEDDYEADDEADSAPHTQGPDIISTDAPRAAKRPRYTRTLINYAERQNLAFRSRRTDFGEFYEHMDLDHASLLGAPTPLPSSSGERRLAYDHMYEEEGVHGSGEEDEEEEDCDEEREDEDEEHAEGGKKDGEEDEQEHDDEPTTRFPVTVAGEKEEESQRNEGVHANDDI